MRYVSVLLVSTLFLLGCRKEGSSTVFIDPALATLVPADTVYLAGVRMEKLADTRFWREYVVKGRVPMVEEFRKRTGLRPEKDLWEIIVAGTPTHATVLIRGKFSDMGLEPKLEREGAQRMSYKGFVMIGDEKTAVLFLNPSTAAAGMTEQLRAIVDNRDKITGIPPELQKRISTIPSTNQAWMVTPLRGVLPGMDGLKAGAFGGLAKLMNSVTFATGALDLRMQFSAKVDFETTDPQAAEQLGGTIRGLLGLGRLNTGDRQREVLTVYDGMQVTKQGNVVHFTTDVPYDVLEKAATELKMFGVR
jgi:hypothetical protein